MQKYKKYGLKLYFDPASALLWVKSKSQVFTKLSVNVIREICSYVSQSPVLFGIREGKLRLYMVKEATANDYQLSFSLPELSLFCIVTSNSVLCVGGHPTSSRASLLILSRTKARIVHLSMLAERFWPGVIKYGPFIYLFGGKDSTSQVLVTSERYSAITDQWTEVQRMNYSRVAFSPCLFANVIYLAEANEKRKPFEAFNPITQEYRKIAIYMVEKRFFGSVSFIVDDSLVFITRSGRVGRWNVRDVAVRSLGTFPLVETNQALSSSSPVKVGRDVYWMRVDTGEVVIYHLNENKLERHG